MTKNDTPIKSISQLQNEQNYNSFKFKNYFQHICNFIPNKKDEKLDIIYIDIDKKDRAGLVYIFVINNKIFYIGDTTNTIKKRMSSINCGTKENREKGTASTNNFYLLQSILNINITVNVYAY